MLSRFMIDSMVRAWATNALMKIAAAEALTRGKIFDERLGIQANLIATNAAGLRFGGCVLVLALVIVAACRGEESRVEGKR